MNESQQSVEYNDADSKIIKKTSLCEHWRVECWECRLVSTTLIQLCQYNARVSHPVLELEEKTVEVVEKDKDEEIAVRKEA